MKENLGKSIVTNNDKRKREDSHDSDVNEEEVEAHSSKNEDGQGRPNKRRRLFVENKRTLTGAQIHFATETDAGRPTPTRNAEYSVPNDKAPGATIITKAAVINTIMGPMTGTMVITTAAVVTIATEETTTVTGTDTLIRINGGMAIRTMTTAAMTIS